MLPDNDGDFVDNPFLSMPSMPIAATKPTARTSPTIVELHALLMQSKDPLFFIARDIPGTSVREWQLVQVAYNDSMVVHPNCLLDGKFLVDFYIQHPDDSKYNAVNQRYWMEYHTMSSLYRADHTSLYHLVKPTSESQQYAHSKGLYP